MVPGQENGRKAIGAQAGKALELTGVALAAMGVVPAAIPLIARVREVSLEEVAATDKGDRADLLRHNVSWNMRCVSTPMATAS
jgi:hypothetical protein